MGKTGLPCGCDPQIEYCQKCAPGIFDKSVAYCKHGFNTSKCDVCKPCPQCARFREKLDREVLGKVIHRNDHDYAESLDWWKEREESREGYRKLADALIKHFKE